MTQTLLLFMTMMSQKTHEKIDWKNGTKILFIIAMHSPKLCKINNILVIKSQYI